MRLVNRIILASAVLLSAASTVRADLFVDNYGTHTVRRYDSETGSSKGAFATVHTPGGMVGGMTFGPGGDLYAMIGNYDKVERFDGVTGAYVSDFVPEDSAHIDGAAGLEFRSDGLLYVVANHSSSVARYDATTGAFHDVFIPSGLGGVKSPTNIAWRDSYVYLNSAVTNQILRYDAVTGDFDSILVAAGAGGLNHPRDLVFGPDGNLYVCSFLSNEVLRYDGSTGDFKDVFVSSSLIRNPVFHVDDFTEPMDLAFGSNGDLFVAAFPGALRIGGTNWRTESQATVLVLTPVPVPGAVLLGSIGLSFAGWLCRRKTT